LGALLLQAAACSDGTMNVADMRNKRLFVNGSLQTGGDLAIQLAADDCPMLGPGAFIKVNGVPQLVDHGDNSGPGIDKGPCYWPGTTLLLPSIPGGMVTVEVGDDTQTVRAVFRPYPAGPIRLTAPTVATASPGGEVVVPFALEGDPAVTDVAPRSFGAFEEDNGSVYWLSTATVVDGAFHFPVPADAAGATRRFFVEAGLMESCENATCDPSDLTAGSDFQPPPAVAVISLTIAP
jgi:hypothetical protein